MLEIYKNFELITMAPIFTQFIWRRRFSRAGEFQLTTPFTADKLEVFAQGNIIYKRNVDEAAFIESRNVIQSVSGELILIVRGRFLQSLLDRRIVTFETPTPLPLHNIIANIWEENFGMRAGTLRTMVPEARMLGFTNNFTFLNVEYRRRNAYDIITSLLQDYRIGLNSRYNFDNKSMDIFFYDPVETDVTFSKEFANIFEQDYRDDTSGYKNVVYIDDEYIHNNHAHIGIDRREMTVPAPSHWLISLRQTAIDALNENRATRTISSVVNPFNRQFEYLKDWNIGSIVLSENRTLNFSGREVIREITEYYDETGMNLEVNLGDYVGRR
ncbi:MAG: siphovirus ReqiPepy6 Gp37-like family protein [Defluviitaleaceae bacterium]|nr:siphovirus ReqiPepy6 Gp37-like family protein [Defluviitaleaceae bacterium]